MIELPLLLLNIYLLANRGQEIPSYIISFCIILLIFSYINKMQRRLQKQLQMENMMLDGTMFDNGKLFGKGNPLVYKPIKIAQPCVSSHWMDDDDSPSYINSEKKTYHPEPVDVSYQQPNYTNQNIYPSNVDHLRRTVDRAFIDNTNLHRQMYIDTLKEKYEKRDRQLREMPIATYITR